MKVPIADWKVTNKQKQLVSEVLESGRLTYGPKTQELEEKFAKIHGRKYAIFTNSGTSALQVSIHALKRKYKWKDGDEIIIPSVTFIATMNVVLQNNLKPVLVDVSRKDLNIDIYQLMASITSRTKAIIPVHLLGQSASMMAIKEIAKLYKLKVIEDSCETMFVKFREEPVGSIGDIACFSSYLAHLMVTGVGGFITTNDEKLSRYIRSMIWHGRHESYLNIDSINWRKRFIFDKPGYSYRATELEAALGLGELETYQENIEKRQQNANYLIENIKNVDFPINNIKEHAFMFFPILTDKRDKLMEHLEKKGIQTRLMMPLTNQPYLKEVLGNIENDYPNAKYINEHGLLLPCHQYLTKEQLNYIIRSINEFNFFNHGV